MKTLRVNDEVNVFINEDQLPCNTSIDNFEVIGGWITELNDKGYIVKFSIFDKERQYAENYVLQFDPYGIEKTSWKPRFHIENKNVIPDFKVKCINNVQYPAYFLRGRTYDVINGVLEGSRYTKWKNKVFHSVRELNLYFKLLSGNYDKPYFELYEENLNFKIKCTKCSDLGEFTFLTEGKIYNVINGKFTDDDGYIWSNDERLFHNINEINNQFDCLSVYNIADFELYIDDTIRIGDTVYCCECIGTFLSSIDLDFKFIYEVKSFTVASTIVETSDNSISKYYVNNTRSYKEELCFKNIEDAQKKCDELNEGNFK